MMKTPWEAVVWDLDGTLANTLNDLAKSMNAALTQHGLSRYPMEAYRYMVGNGLRKLAERAAGENAPQSLVDGLIADFLQIYDRDCLHFTKPYEGMPETLAALKSDGVRLLVVTNKPDAQAQKIVTGLFGSSVFDGVFGGRDGRKTKPEPTLTLQALALVHASPARSLFVGDSDVDILTAQNAGMGSAGAVWGFRGEEELARAGADYLLRKPLEILNTY